MRRSADVVFAQRAKGAGVAVRQKQVRGASLFSLMSHSRGKLRSPIAACADCSRLLCDRNSAAGNSGATLGERASWKRAVFDAIGEDTDSRRVTMSFWSIHCSPTLQPFAENEKQAFDPTFIDNAWRPTLFFQSRSPELTILNSPKLA
jgi:hypothetical protein